MLSVCILYRLYSNIGFGLDEFTVRISNSVITFIVVVKFLACSIATAQEA